MPLFVVAPKREFLRELFVCWSAFTTYIGTSTYSVFAPHTPGSREKFGEQLIVDDFS
jgi:hypothetical protein